MVALDPQWRPLFATAVMTGMRKGEFSAFARRTSTWRSGPSQSPARMTCHDEGWPSDLLPVAH